MRRLVILAALLVALSAPASVSAAQKTGCPAPTSDWEPFTVDQLAIDFFPHLLPGQFETVEELAAAIAVYDRNGDGSVCAKWMWDEELNPNANWYGVVQMFPRDNNANGS